MGTSIPFVQAVPDAFLPEQPAQIAIIVEKGVLIADDQHDVHPPQRRETLRTVEIGEILDRGMEIDQRVPMAAEQVAEAVHIQGQVIAPGEGRDLLEQMGVAQRDIDGVEGPQAAPVGDGAGVRDSSSP